ncbi:MAG TPA: hypothetical protein VFI96_01830 [Longimicrobiaceae bacterium]|nr:hypothetical protein [Longimicrobiaceae bacterium]
MLHIRRADDGRLHLSNNRQSGVAGDEAEARRKLYRWGHTDLSISKALAEMREAAGEQAASNGWRVLRPSDATPERAAEEPEKSEKGEAKPMPEKKKRSTRRRATAAEAPAKAPAKAPAPKAAKPARKPRAAPKKPPTADSSGVELALEHFRAGARELKKLEAAQLPFARGPWTELREKADLIVTSLQGK